MQSPEGTSQTKQSVMNDSLKISPQKKNVVRVSSQQGCLCMCALCVQEHLHVYMKLKL